MKKSHFLAMFLGLVSTAGPALAQATDENRQLHNTWINCLKSNARQLSKGRDAADVVANGVVAACDQKLDAYVDSMRRESDDPAVAARTESIVFDALREGARKGALQDVLQARSTAPSPRKTNARHQ